LIALQSLFSIEPRGPALPEPPIITLTTDFGLDDHFVGTMKGVILSINPAVQFADICHRVSSYDVQDGALTLALSYRYFPPGTIHLVIVDPGVGSTRRPIVVSARGYWFVAPDNGVLSLVYRDDKRAEVRHVTADRYFLNPVSNTFHGRDIFAPVAGWLSRGVAGDEFGALITDFVQLAWPVPVRKDGGEVEGSVMKVDKFGNLITNIAPEDAPELFAAKPAPFRITVEDIQVSRLYTSYSMGKPSELFAILGSSGYLEVCRNLGSAADALQATRGSPVKLTIG
jgi:S-adenosyl-L-methionine hydrolase (adenosine-forming)